MSHQVLLNRLKLAYDGRLVKIPTRLISDEYGFSLAPEGWHYFRSLAAEFEHNPEIRLEDTIFFKFFQHEKIKSVRYVNDLLFLHNPNKSSQVGNFNFYFSMCPWGDWSKGCSFSGVFQPWGYYHDLIEGKMTRDLFGYRKNIWYEPSDRYPLEQEFYYFKYIYNSIKNRGYSPVWFGDLPAVVLFVRCNGEWLAVKHDGHHRLTVLSHLGYDKVTVSISPESIGVVREAEVEQWYYVKRGLCTTEQALEIFNAYFELNGRERLQYLGLPSVY
ncbi:MAG: hypothetical protein HC852_07730 [Acaryochloridaceae cyanobacterium RU_4_10]|nr:hypothetical protein [Acaryochloridaceae cyanobacterium RU_4_10]